MNYTHKIFAVVCRSVDLNILKMAASRRVSMIPKSFISLQTGRLEIHEKQSSCIIMFFPNTKITDKISFNCKCYVLLCCNGVM